MNTNFQKTFSFIFALCFSTFLMANTDIDASAGIMEVQSADEVTVVEGVQTYTVTSFQNIAPEGTASAQSTYPGYSAANINDGDLTTTVGGSYSWANGHTRTEDGLLPQWLQLEYTSERTFARVVLYTSSSFDLKDYDIQVFSGESWFTVVEQRDNTDVQRIHDFSPVNGTAIRVLAYRGPDNQPIYARVNELEVYEIAADNVALTATVTAQSTYAWYSPAHVNDGDTDTRLGSNYSWANDDGETLPQWLELDFTVETTVSSVELYTSIGYEIQDYDMQVWVDDSWVTVVEQRGNTSVSRTHSFTPVSTSKLRVIGYRGPERQPAFVRINELEVY